jgi:hypothetical protein
MFTGEIVPAMPANTNSLSFLPVCNSGADSVDLSSHLMTWYSRELKSRPQAIFDEDIAVANTTRLDSHANLPGTGLRGVAFN